jgi:hypothetical protein
MRGGFRSWGGCLDTLITTYSLGWSLRDLRGFDREVMSEVDRELMGLGVSRVCTALLRVYSRNAWVGAKMENLSA